MNEYQRVIKFSHPDLPLPPDLSKSSQELDEYLSTLKESSEAAQRKQYRYEKMAETRRLFEQQKQLKKPNVTEVSLEERSVAVCNNTLEDSAIIVEKRIGYRLTCPRCNWVWIWHGRKDRFFVSCSRCHKSFKLGWK